MPVPPEQVKNRVNELLGQIESKFIEWRDWGKRPVAATVSAILGSMRNALNGYRNRSTISSVATFGRVEARVTFDLVSKMHIPFVSHLADVLKIGVDELFKRGTKKLLRPAFDVKSEPDWATFKKQGEYVVLSLAQKVCDEILKVENARNSVNAASKPQDCPTFVGFLTACQYFYYRVDRLAEFNGMPQQWAEQVNKVVLGLDEECLTLKENTYLIAGSIVGDLQLHLNACCKREGYCLYNSDWLQVETIERIGPPTAPPYSLPDATGRPVQRKISVPTRPGAAPLPRSPWKKP